MSSISDAVALMAFTDHCYPPSAQPCSSLLFPVSPLRSVPQLVRCFERRESSDAGADHISARLACLLAWLCGAAGLPFLLSFSLVK